MKKLLLIATIAVFAYGYADSRPFRLNQIPNGGKFGCLSCHVGTNGGALNPMGQDVGQSLNGFDVNWIAIYDIDSDKDGFTNGEELQDPNGDWSVGSPNPGDFASVTHPGNADDFPSSIEEELSGFELFLSKDEIYLTSDQSSDLNMDIQIINTIGQILLSESTDYGFNSKQISLSSINSGAYYLIIRKGKKTYTRGFKK